MSPLLLCLLVLLRLLCPTQAEHVENTTTLVQNAHFKSWIALNAQRPDEWSLHGDLTTTMATKGTTTPVLQLQGAGANGGRLCQVLSSAVLTPLSTYEIQWGVWSETANVAVVEIFDGDSCTTVDSANKRVLQLTVTQAGVWSTMKHRFQASDEAVVSVALVVGTGTSLWMSGVDVYRVLCTPASSYLQSRSAMLYGAMVSAAVSGGKIYAHTHWEQVFGKIPYTGDMNAWLAGGGALSTSPNPPPAFIYDNAKWNTECTGPNARTRTCWPQNTNLNVRVFDSDDNSWNRDGVDLPLFESGNMASCDDGTIFLIGTRTGVSSGVTANVPIWSFHPSTNVWDTTSHTPFFPKGFLGGGMECVKSTLFVIGSQHHGCTGCNQYHIAKYDTATKVWDMNFSDESQWVPFSSAGFGTAVWRTNGANKLIVAGGQRRNKAVDGNYGRGGEDTARDGLSDYRAARVVNLETGVWEQTLPELPASCRSYPAVGIVDNFLYITVTVPGTMNWNLIRYDLQQRYQGRWQYLPGVIQSPTSMSMINTRFSIHAIGGSFFLGTIASTDRWKYLLSNAVTQIGACPAGCFMERASPQDVCNP